MYYNYDYYILQKRTKNSYRKQKARQLRIQYVEGIYNKCIGDDTKAAARQSPNCIKNQKN